MLDKTKWLWRLMRSSTYAIVTDKEAVCRVNMRDPFTFDTVVMLAAQYSALLDFQDNLNEAIHEHERASAEEFGYAAEDFVRTVTKKRKPLTNETVTRKV